MKTRFYFLSIAFALLLIPKTSHARDYNPNTGRFQTMDAFEGTQSDPQSLHKYTYCQNDPVDGTDPSGEAVYFVERKFDAWYGDPTWALEYGHGYLLFTATSNPGTVDPFWAGQPILHTFSWHPYTWDLHHATMGNTIGVPGRVWENHPADTDPGILHNAVPVTSDASQQAILLNYINGWMAAAKPGYDYGDPIHVKDENGHKNDIGKPHIPAPANGVFYSLYGQNCVWWDTVMLKNSGINVPQSVYTEISQYNHGVGYASYVISGERSPTIFGTTRGIPLGINLSLPGYDLSGFDTGL